MSIDKEQFSDKNEVLAKILIDVRDAAEQIETVFSDYFTTDKKAYFDGKFTHTIEYTLADGTKRIESFKISGKKKAESLEIPVLGYGIIDDVVNKFFTDNLPYSGELQNGYIDILLKYFNLIRLMEIFDFKDIKQLREIRCWNNLSDLIKRETLKEESTVNAEEWLKNIVRPIENALIHFIDKNEWGMYSFNRHGSTLMVNRYLDYRIHEWQIANEKLGNKNTILIES